MAFHPGQLVVCVDDSSHDEWFGPYTVKGLDGLKRGVVYTVRDVAPTLDAMMPGIHLVEIVRPLRTLDPYEGPYAACRFRPITDDRLQIFRSLLAPTPKQKVDA